MRNLHKIRSENSWNKKIPRSGDKDFLESYKKFIVLIYSFEIIETSHIQKILGYTQKRTVQKYLHAMKQLGYISNERIGNSHYWFLTHYGAERIGQKIGDGIHTSGEIKRKSLTSNLVASLVEDPSFPVTSVQANNDYTTVQIGASKLCVVSDVGKKIEVHLDDADTIVVIVTQADHERAWELAGQYENTGLKALAVSESHLQQFGAYSEIWSTNIDNIGYKNISQFIVVQDEAILPIIGTEEWLGSI